MKIMFNRTKTDSFQVGTFDEKKNELVINCPIWQFAKSNQLKLSVVEETIEGTCEEIIVPISELVPSQEGPTVPTQTTIPNNPPEPNIPPVQEIVNIPSPAPDPAPAPAIVPQQQAPAPAPAPVPVPVPQQPVQQPVQPVPTQQTPVPFNPVSEGLTEMQPQVPTAAVSVDKVNIKQALADRSLTEVEFITALDAQGYGQFGTIDNVPDEVCKGCLQNIKIVENAIIEMRKLTNA